MPKERLDKGLIQVYTGDGKGKTTCALGLALRAAGQGFRVYIIQFMKGRKTGESGAAARLAPEVTLRYFGRGSGQPAGAGPGRPGPGAGGLGPGQARCWPRGSTTW